MCELIFSGAFEDDDVTHVEDDVNPVRDLEIISEELRKKVNKATVYKAYPCLIILINVVKKIFVN